MTWRFSEGSKRTLICWQAQYQIFGCCCLWHLGSCPEVKENGKNLSDHLMNKLPRSEGESKEFEQTLDVYTQHGFQKQWPRLNRPELYGTCDRKANTLLANWIVRVQSHSLRFRKYWCFTSSKVAILYCGKVSARFAAEESTATAPLKKKNKIKKRKLQKLSLYPRWYTAGYAI